MHPTDAEIAVAAFLRFREEVQEAGIRIDNAAVIQLMIADRLNVIADYLGTIADRAVAIDETLVRQGR